MRNPQSAMRSVASVLGLCLLLAGSLPAMAGELVLKNGDRVQGELVLIDKNSLVWKSTSFGELTVGKNKVADLKMDKPVSIRGQRGNCTVVGMQEHYLAYRCGRSTYVQRTELLTLAEVKPYVEKSEKSYEYGGKMAVSGVFQRGNSEQDDLDVLATSSYRRGNLRHVTTIDIDTLSVADGPTTEDYEAIYRLDWFFHEKWFWYNALSGGKTESKAIKEFYEYGSGLGVQMWENVNSALALESGIDFVKERYQDTTTEDLEAAAWRFATRYRYKLPWLSARLVHNNEVLYSLEDSEDWELSADLGLSVPLGPGLFSEYMIEYDYDNLPAEGTRREDTKFTVGIGYQW